MDWTRLDASYRGFFQIINRPAFRSAFGKGFCGQKTRGAGEKTSNRDAEIWGRVHLRTIRLGGDQLVLIQIENLTAQKELVTIQKYKKLVEIFPIGIAEFDFCRHCPMTCQSNSAWTRFWMRSH